LADKPVGLCQPLRAPLATAEFSHQGILTLDATMLEILEGSENRSIYVNSCPRARLVRDAAEVLAPQAHTIRDA